MPAPAPEGPTRTVAVIGSFRQHLDDVRTALSTFAESGWEITSPPGVEIIEPGVPFVRFKADKAEYDDATIQTIAMHRILRADLIYVVAPDGYVGRTTCYEIGRAVQTDSRVYFSEAPNDLPISVPTEAIREVGRLAAHTVDQLVHVSAWPDPTGHGWEHALIEERYLPL